MIENGMYPGDALDKDSVASYWGHLASMVEWGSQHVRRYGHTHQPLYLWGDDAQYNEANDKLVTVALGAVLDCRKDAVATVWPLFCYRWEIWTH